MSDGMLIDDKGRVWPDNSWEVARRLGYRHASLDLPGFAVQERGFIHIRPQEGGVRVALRTGHFGLAALGGALYALKEQRWRRILLAVLTEEKWIYEIIASIWEFADRAEHLAAGGPIEARHPWLAAERDLAALALPHFSQIRPLVELWRESHGRMCDDIERRLYDIDMLNRAILLRQPRGSSRLIVEHFGAGITILRPCEALMTIGHDFAKMPDRDYGRWVAGTYAAALADRRLRLDSIRAEIGTSEATTIRIRYDRLLLPWRSSADEAWIMGISMRRELSVVA